MDPRRTARIGPVGVLMVLLGVSCGPPRDLPQGAKEEPLLLLADEPQAAMPPGAADNSRCFVCHINYAQESFSHRHARVGIGCETCHGPSDAHCSDENNITPPQIMFPREKIATACLACHDRSALAAVVEHKFSQAPWADLPVCTDCHAPDHRLAHRTRRWDKTTGRLVQDDAVRMHAPIVP